MPIIPMRNRHFWFQKVEAAWNLGNFVWLTGVRQSGKSSVALNLPQSEYYDCGLAANRRALDHPLEILSAIQEGRIVLDDVDRLVDPLALIRLAREHFPGIAICVTSSSPPSALLPEAELQSLRIEEIWLTPMIGADLADFQQHDLQRRFSRGGLPPFFLADSFPERAFQEWSDGYWHNVVQDRYKLERRASFQRLLDDLLADSGEIFEATRYATKCGASRTTIMNYLSVMEATYAVSLLKPFNSRRSTEIIAAPRVYGFDTGFIAFHRGWSQLRRSDFAPMWTHFVLNELHAALQTRNFYYWRDKRGHKVDFVFARRIHAPTAIECAWSTSDFDPTGLLSFRKQYLHGENIVVCHDVTQPFQQTYKQISVNFVPLHQVVDQLVSA